MTINLDQLSPEQLTALKEQIQAEERQKEIKQQEDRKAYKQMVNDTLPILFNELLGASAELSRVKTLVFSELKALIELKASAYGKEDNLQSHSFTTNDGINIIIGHRFNDGWDDSVTAGIEKVNKYLESLISDQNTKTLVTAIRKLLSKDAKGTLKASRVIQLKKIADDTADPVFIDAVKIIQDAYRPTQSCEFVTCRYKDNNGNSVDLPLEIASADFDFQMPLKYAQKTKEETLEAGTTANIPNQS